MTGAEVKVSEAPAATRREAAYVQRLPALPPWLGSVLAVALCAVAAAYPLLDSTNFGLGRIELTLFYLTAAMALNLVHGFGGVLMIGQPALMTAGGYTAGILSSRYGWEFWATFPLAIVAAVALSLFMCSPSIRVQGWYLAVLSFMGVALVPNVGNVTYTITGGTDGLHGIQPISFGSFQPPRWAVYELILAMAIVVFIAVRNLIRSGWGLSLLALRDHPVMATASGVSKIRVRLALFTLTGIPCGAVGAMYAHSQEFFSYYQFGSLLVLLLIGGTLMGGRGTLWGPVFGVSVFSAISLWLGPFSLYNPLILGLGVSGVVILFPRGIVGSARYIWDKYGPQRGAAAKLLSDVSDSGNAITPVEKPPHLEVRNISKHFSGNAALTDVGLTVRGGSIVTVIGANGSGKTTLLNCVSGFVTPDSGEVLLDGREIGDMSPYHRAHLGIGRTFQLAKLVEELSVQQNVALGVFGNHPQTVGAALFRTPRFRRREAFASERALEACRAIGLSQRAMAAKASELTLALKRLVEIARALAGNASVICLDEPVAGLNIVVQARVAEVLRELAASGRAVLLIEHNLPFVLSISDELILLKDGKVEDRGTPVDAGDPNRPLGWYFQAFVAKADKPKVEEAIRAATEAQQRKEGRLPADT